MPASILIVDDDAQTSEGLRELLARAGYRALVAYTFRDAVNVLSAEAPDLMIVDVRLGEFNGLQLIVLSDRPIPAIVVTGFEDPVLEQEARRLGADYLMKPISPRDLLARVERLLAAQPQTPSRRWNRKAAQLPAAIAAAPARVVNVSYGGVCLETDPAHSDLPPSFELTLPDNRVSIQVSVVWKRPRNSQGWLFGAEVREPNPTAVGAWRGLVDAIA